MHLLTGVAEPTSRRLPSWPHRVLATTHTMLIETIGLLEHDGISKEYDGII